LIFDKGAYVGGKNPASSTNAIGKTGYLYVQKTETTPLSLTLCKNQFKMNERP
jgi:hypothetical protein